MSSSRLSLHLSFLAGLSGRLRSETASFYIFHGSPPRPSPDKTKAGRGASVPVEGLKAGSECVLRSDADALLSLHSEQALLTARRDPILSRDRGPQRPRYPHVYDSYAEASKMAAFVGGARVSIPSTAARGKGAKWPKQTGRTAD